MQMKKLLLIPLFLFSLTNAFSQDKKETPKWDVEKYKGPIKTFNINTNEGTWMNLDVSPDGKEIVFDLLGDIYVMPITGGTAKLLSGGIAYEVQPRFSPNGKYISFTSDRSGADNIWIMDRQGGNKKQITKESFRLLNNATWMPNSEYIIARKHFTASRSLGAGEMWMYNIYGGDGVQLTKRKNDQQDAGEPNVSPDGRYVYFSEDVSPGPSFQYSKDPNGLIYAIRQLDLTTGKLTHLIAEQGGAVRPQISPDGKFLAYVKRVRLKSVLYLQNLKTGEDYPLYDDLSKDQQETWAIFGVYPNFAWTPDSKTIVFYAKGKIKQIELNNLSVKDIPFEVNSNQTIQQALHFDQQVFTPEFTVKMIRQLVTSPDGKMLVFNAAGYLYKKELPNGLPERLTNGMDFEFEPKFSPDGKFVVYTTWSDEFKGAIKRTDIKTGKTITLTDEKGYYYSPSYSNKGDKIVFRKGSGNEVLGLTYGKNTGIYMIPSNGGSKILISDNGIRPMFNADDTRIYFQGTDSGKKAFKSIDLNGANERIHYTSQYATQFCPSPDGKWMAFTELFNAYITPMVTAGTALDLSSGNKAIPLAKVTKDAGTYLHWSADSKKLLWTLGEKYYNREIKNTFSFIEGAPQILPELDTVGLSIGLRLKTDLPTGLVALKGARIITMKGEQVIEEGTILLENNKIKAIGKVDEVSIPENAKVLEVTGKTIMPGMVDVHAHLRTSPDGVSPQQDWSYMANLSFGVTTSHDPSSNTEMVFSQAEMLKAGRMVGPRLYSTGSILYGADGDFKVVINSLDDALSHLKRLKAVGAGRMMMRFGGGVGGNREYYYTFADQKLVEVFDLMDTTYMMPSKLTLAANNPTGRGGNQQNNNSAVQFLPVAPTVEVIKSDETKKILNLNCNKVVVKTTRKAKILDMEKDIVEETTLWYTNDLGFNFSPNPNLWTEGTVLAIENKGGGTVAKSIEYRGVSNKDVTAPKKAIAITPEEYQSKLEAMMKRFRGNNNRGQNANGATRIVIN